MKFEMIRPCAHCPFRTDIPPYLRTARAQQICDVLTQGSGGTFACHETTELSEDEDGNETLIQAPSSQHCAGALIMLTKMKWASRIMDLARHIGLFNPKKLDLTAPVYDNPKAMVDAHREANQ